MIKEFYFKKKITKILEFVSIDFNNQPYRFYKLF